MLLPFSQHLVDGFKPLDFFFNQGESVLLSVCGVLAASDVLAAILVCLLSCDLLNPADVLTAELVVLVLKSLNFLKQPFDRSEIIYQAILHVVQEVEANFPHVVGDDQHSRVN